MKPKDSELFYIPGSVIAAFMRYLQPLVNLDTVSNKEVHTHWLEFMNSDAVPTIIVPVSNLKKATNVLQRAVKLNRFTGPNWNKMWIQFTKALCKNL